MVFLLPPWTKNCISMSAELWLKLLSYCHVLFSEYCMLHTYQITVLGCLNEYSVGERFLRALMPTPTTLKTKKQHCGAWLKMIYSKVIPEADSKEPLEIWWSRKTWDGSSTSQHKCITNAGTSSLTEARGKLNSSSVFYKWSFRGALHSANG